MTWCTHLFSGIGEFPLEDVIIWQRSDVYARVPADDVPLLTVTVVCPYMQQRTPQIKKCTAKVKTQNN